ncbi:hypothetical protein E3N88_08855 [Mikania micrantha]|uniref:Zinc finger PHD-type domain-containing protein n=1 Tax=Mikania micrantha TaxID=192012 RepID=A0A5N6PHF2_9ASTR|nr:hypothetical protein E3N88_08855 [Mikania micrantha]
MASSDEEDEIVLDSVTNYHFIDSCKVPVSFSVLPLHWNDHDDVIENGNASVALLGLADGGLQSVYTEVIGWKLELSYVMPEVYVLSKGKRWIKLQKPRNSYGDIIKSVLIVIRCLHFVKRNVRASRKDVSSYLMKSFSSYDFVEPEKCLYAHVPLIRSAVANDKDLAKSKYLEVFLMESENPGRREALHEDNQMSNKFKFIASDEDDETDGDFDDEDEDEELFDSVCAFCDNGGHVLLCDGQCLRSFHPTIKAGVETSCESLGFNNAAEYEAIATYLCYNCSHKKHQCFACGMLGSSDKTSAEVFQCASATCGHFYHPECVANLIHPSDETLANQLKSQIASREPFTCPIHKCHLCQNGENKDEYELQFAICRRCPKAYHRKCLPKKIAFEGSADGTIEQRAWDDLLPKRILMYCMKHKIIPRLKTPKRDHLLFPSIERKRNREGIRTNMMVQRRSNAFGNLKGPTTEKMPTVIERRHNTVAYSDTALVKGVSSTMHKKTSSIDNKKSISGNLEQPSDMVRSKQPYKDTQRERHFTIDNKIFISGNLEQPSDMVRSKQPYKDTQRERYFTFKPVKEAVVSSLPKVDADMKTRLLKLMEDSTSSYDLEEFINEKKRKCTYAIYAPQYGLDKTITIGKVEASVEAVKAALKILENKGRVEDAKAVCEPNVLYQLIKWKKRLRVFLAPFFHGARYTSFGRHFTKVDKLKEIVDRLHWYVEDGDMIVDFCCGSNDFSCFMKEKLDIMGKRCKFKNYDLITPKNAFNFEKRDWFSVPVEALPDGSRLVMGLNPPFGVHASLANKFIDHALKFKPKLIILIVPKETRRLDCKSPRYDLIWEERNMLSGKSFYLPGSVNIRDQPLDDWNVKPPPLSLWSRPDWTAKHSQLAKKHGHTHQKQYTSHHAYLDNVPRQSHAIPPNYENTNTISHKHDNIMVDMDMSDDPIPVNFSTNPPCTQPRYLGQHPGIGPPHDANTSVQHMQSGHRANYGYAGSCFYYDQPDYGHTAYPRPPNSSVNQQAQPDFASAGTTYPMHRHN